MKKKELEIEENETRKVNESGIRKRKYKEE